MCPLPPDSPHRSDPPWQALHDGACERGDDHYIDPATGYRVFTRVGLERRGECCGSGCRHCPWDHVNVVDRG